MGNRVRLRGRRHPEPLSGSLEQPNNKCEDERHENGHDFHDRKLCGTDWATNCRAAHSEERRRVFVCAALRWGRHAYRWWVFSCSEVCKEQRTVCQGVSALAEWRYCQKFSIFGVICVLEMHGTVSHAP